MNIIYIHSHDTGRFIEPYGAAVPTPNLQQFADESVLFRQAFCANPTCSPSRTSLLSGQYPHVCGMLGDHGLMGKSTWREPSSGIPLVVAGPGVARGRVTDALTSLIDLAATFLDYGGAHPLADSDARSLRPVLEKKTGRHREVVVCGLREWRMACDGRFKLVTGVPDGPLLFDLQNDPTESRNLYGQYPEQTALLHAHLKKPASTENNERIQE
jgi:arylsulfatase A-like enzyme